jgi:plastocyanin
MKSKLIIPLVIVVVLIIGAGIYFLSPKSNPVVTNPPAGKNIEISNFAFSPSTLNVHVGDTVTWTNMDSVSHTITSDSGSELSSSPFGNGNTFSHTFATAGTFHYHCSIHTMMKGEVIVQ